MYLTCFYCKRKRKLFLYFSLLLHFFSIISQQCQMKNSSLPLLALNSPKILFSDLCYFNCLLTDWSMYSSIPHHYMSYTANRVIFFFPVCKSCCQSLKTLLWFPVQCFSKTEFIDLC